MNSKESASSSLDHEHVSIVRDLRLVLVLNFIFFSGIILLYYADKHSPFLVNLFNRYILR